MKKPNPHRWMIFACLLTLAAMTSTMSARAQTAGTPVQQDVLRLHDGTIHLGTLKSFDGAVFEFQTDAKLLRISRAEVAGILLPGPRTTVTATAGTVQDIDGNIYKTVKIGHQVWMAENLRTTKYNDGTSINLITDFQAWGKATTGAYSWYMNNIDNKPTYGGLYNMKAAESKKICPKGWHVPVIEEWDAFVTALGSNPGSKIKEVGTKNWLKNTSNVTNESGFNALPAGYRNANGQFYNAGSTTCWWSTTAHDAKNYLYRGVSDYSSLIWKYPYPGEFGLSIRCVRD